MQKKNKTLVYGVGINDADYKVTKYRRTDEIRSDGRRKQVIVWKCKYYEKWKGMLERVYSAKLHKKEPSYKNCTVCVEWLYFSKFKAWVDEQPDRGWMSKHLDKDSLFVGNKHYSPETCVFLSGNVNRFFCDCAAARGELMLGVDISASKKNPFKAQCEDPLKRFKRYLGVFSTEVEAHLAWKNRKHKYAIALAEIQTDQRVKEALRTRYL